MFPESPKILNAATLDIQSSNEFHHPAQAIGKPSQNPKITKYMLIRPGVKAQTPAL
jgi:hypothetical protein